MTMLPMTEDNDVLGSAVQGLSGRDTFFWEDDDEYSWSFPILAADQEESGNRGHLWTHIENPDVGLRRKGKEAGSVVEVEPPLAANGKKRKADSLAGSDDEKNEEGENGGEREQHIWIERARRKKMRDMFANLHALMPRLSPKADKATIVDEAVIFIQKLQQTLRSLQMQKDQRFHQNYKLSDQSREAFLAEQGSTGRGPVALPNPSPLFSGGPVLFKTWTSPNVILSACGKDAQINICCPTKVGLLAGICLVLDKYKIEVLSAQVSSGINGCMFMIQVRASGPFVQFPGSSLLVEEIFKQAAAELVVWVQLEDGHA